MRHVAMVGSGAWGSAFARAIRQGCRLTFWARDNAAAVRAADFVNTADDCGDDSAASFAAVSVNSIAQAAKDAEVIVLAVSSGGFAEVLKKIKPFAATVPIIWLSKGFVGDDDIIAVRVCRRYFGGGWLLWRFERSFICRRGVARTTDCAGFGA